MTGIRSILRRGRGADAVIGAYDAQRDTPHHPGICNAPFSNLYFAASGKVGPCWIQLGDMGERWSPDRSIRDIWTGPTFTNVNDFRALYLPG